MRHSTADSARRRAFQPSEPTVSVIIATYARPRALERCLRALSRQTLAADRFEVIVCDDGSPVSVAEQHAALLGELRLKHEVRVVRQRNAGPAAARNRGAAQARGRYLAFTDDDCSPARDWLERLVDRIDAMPDALLGGSMANGLAGDPYASATHAIMDFVYAEQERASGERLFSTCNLVVPAPAFRALGGFSPRFPDAAGEDYDLCARWHESGRPAAYVPEAVVEHAHGHTLRSYLRQHFNYGRGLLRMRRRRDTRHSDGALRGPWFYLRLVVHPVRRWWDPAAWRSAALIGASQLATAVGAAAELHASRRAGAPAVVTSRPETI